MYDVESKPTLTGFLIQPATPSCLLSLPTPSRTLQERHTLHTLHTLRILRLLHASLRRDLCSVGPLPNWRLESRWRCSSRCSSPCRLAAAAAAAGSPMNVPARLPVRKSRIRRSPKPFLPLPLSLRPDLYSLGILRMHQFLYHLPTPSCCCTASHVSHPPKVLDYRPVCAILSWNLECCNGSPAGRDMDDDVDRLLSMYPDRSISCRDR